MNLNYLKNIKVSTLDIYKSVLPFTGIENRIYLKKILLKIQVKKFILNV